jgi:hypothetical protein
MEKEFDVHFKRDGDTWSAHLNDKSETKTAGFGTSPEEALRDLFLEDDKDRYQKEVNEKKTTH